MSENINNGNHRDATKMLKYITDWVMADTAVEGKIAEKLKHQVGRRIIWTPEAQQQAHIAARLMMISSILSDALEVTSTVHNLFMGNLHSYCNTPNGLQPVKVKLTGQIRDPQEAAVTALLALGVPPECIVRDDGSDDNKPSPIILTKG